MYQPKFFGVLFGKFNVRKMCMEGIKAGLSA